MCTGSSHVDWIAGVGACGPQGIHSNLGSRRNKKRRDQNV